MTAVPAAHPVAGLPRWRHCALGDVGSTNDLAMEAARSGDAGRLWITAERQLSGKGRRGRQWVSEPGNFYGSALLVLDAPDAAALGTLPLVAGLAVLEALSNAAPTLAPALALKWPNDVLCGSAKLAGILLEGAALPAARHAVIIGCGVNLAHRPETAAYPATSVLEQGVSLAPETFFPHLAGALDETLALWDAGRGVEAVVARWRSVAAGLGGPIRVNWPDRSLDGRFADIDAEGYLLLETREAGVMRIAAGDVFLLS